MVATCVAIKVANFIGSYLLSDQGTNDLVLMDYGSSSSSSYDSRQAACSTKDVRVESFRSRRLNSLASLV